MSLATRAAVTIDTKRGQGRRPRTSSTTGDKVVGGVSHVVLVVWSLVVILPLLWTLSLVQDDEARSSSRRSALPANWNFDNYVNAWTRRIGPFFLNTVIVVGCALVLVMVLGAMCAYVLARFRFPAAG